MRFLKAIFPCLLFVNSAFAALSVEPEGPYLFDTDSGTPRMFIATTGVNVAAIDTTKSFKQFDVTTLTTSVPSGTTSGALIALYITGIPADKEDIQILAVSGGSHMIAPIYPSTTSGRDPYIAPASSYYYSVKTNGMADLWLYVNLYAICQIGGNAVEGCNNNSVSTLSTNSSWGFQLKAIARDDTESLTTVPSSTSGAYAFNIYPQENQGTTSCSGASPYFFPADRGITVDPARFTFAANSNGSSSVKGKLVVMANVNPGGLNYGAGLTWTSHTILGRGNPTGEQTFDGYTNYDPTNGSVIYDGGYAFQDSAGVMTSTACGPDTQVAGEIASFLKESNCFIAGASFDDENAKPVLLLREFRDRILSKYKAGRKFISFYYTEGPKAAAWLREHSYLRPVSLGLLVPIEMVAWISLHAKILWIPFALLVFFAFALTLRSRSKVIATLFLALVLFSSETRAESAASSSNQPYIDSLLSGIQEEEGPVVERTTENPDPYIQKLKKRISKKEPSAGYTEELKKELDPEESGSYTEELKKELGPGEQKSAIADFKSGKKLKERRSLSPAKGSFGFRLMTSSNRTYNAGSAEEVAYNTAYGDGWTPDILFSYETRPFKGWGANRLGVMGAFGFSWAQADAKFKYSLPGFSTKSKTKIKFITFPLLVGLTYKVNLFGFLYPYVGAGPGAFVFYETRSDGLGSSRGYSFGNWFIAGMNFGIDWLSKSGSWDRYSSSGIKHSYISLEYSRQSTFSGGLVDMTVDGLAVGFNFEI